MLLSVAAIIGTAVGLVIGCFLASSKSNARLADYKIESEGKLRAAETSILELRSRVADQKLDLGAQLAEIAKLQDSLKTESEHKASALGELQHARSALDELAVIRDQRNIETQLRAVAETKLAESQTNLESQRKLLHEAEEKLSTAFGALSAEALKSNNRAFLDLAKGEFATIQAQAKGDLDAREAAIRGVVLPLKDTLELYDKRIQEMEGSRQSAYGSLNKQLEILATANEQLQRETGNLVTALRSPQVRGRWGEMTLKRAAELAGMSEYCDFTEQETLTNDDCRQRPDMIVNLPGNRRIVVDAKVPLQAFLQAISANNDADRKSAFARHGQLVRNHMDALGLREYWAQFDQAPEVVVLFLPGESFFSAAVEQDRTLIEDGINKKVFLATPTTLIALLRTVAHLWRQQEIEKNAEEISKLGKQLYDRINIFASHFEGMGVSLKRAVEAFNKAAASLESRVLTGARKFKELKAAVGDEILDVNPIVEIPRSLSGSGAAVSDDGRD